MDLKKCKTYLKNFLETEYPNKTLEKQLENLKTYNFAQMGLKENTHEDSTTLAKAIYFIIWHTSENNEYGLPLLTSLQLMEENYGGETINTFNTLFQESLEGAKLYIGEDDEEFYNEVKNFQKLYLTIGNFMLLPTGKSNGLTLNTKKGSYNFRYKDYCDLFLFDLFETSNLDDLKSANKEYFEQLTKEQFFKKIFLEDYYKNDHAAIVFEHELYNDRHYPLYWWKFQKNYKEHSKDYRKFALDYIDKASTIINKRAEIMINILKQQIKD